MDVTPVAGDEPTGIAQKKAQLRSLIAENDRSLWDIGDLISELTEAGANLAELSADTGWSVPRLSSIKKTSEGVAPAERDPNLSFFHYEKAREAANRIADEVQLKLSQNPSPAIVQAISQYATPDSKKALTLILEKEQTPLLDDAGNTKTDKKGNPKFKRLDKRACTNLLGDIVKDAIAAATPAPSPVQADPCLDRCYFEKAETILVHLAKEGVKAKLVNLDPPYGAYCKHDDGHLDINTSAASHVGADNIDRDDAIATTCATIRLLPDVLAEGGTILLWQAAFELRKPILEAIDESGFEVEIAVIWDKSRPQPGHYPEAWTQQCELCWVLKRKGEKLLNHANVGRSNVLSAQNNRDFWFEQSAGSLDDSHVWAKPVKLMEHFVAKCTYQGETVLDLYGCTGSMAIAAAQMNRRFVYSESFDENYQTFSPKVLAALETAQKKLFEALKIPPLEMPKDLTVFEDAGTYGILPEAILPVQ